LLLAIKSYRNPAHSLDSPTAADQRDINTVPIFRFIIVAQTMRTCSPASRAAAKDPNFVAIIERGAVSAANATASLLFIAEPAREVRESGEKMEGRQ